MSFWSRHLAVVLAIGLVSAPAAAEGPAVESPNGKLALDGGRVDGESLQLLDGSFAFPITEKLGAQLDAAGGLFSGDDFVYGGGAQLFWRDPELALVGIEAIYADRPEENLAVRRFGGSSELYLDRFTVAGGLGYQRSRDLGNGGYSSLDFTFYASDDLALRLGGALAPGEEGDLLRAGIEFQPAGGRGMSLFADGAYGGEDFDSLQAGVRFYFDDSRSLRDRHRRQDPDGIGGLLIGLDKPKARPCAPMPRDYKLLRGPGRPIDVCAPPPLLPPPCEECS